MRRRDSALGVEHRGSRRMFVLVAVVLVFLVLPVVWLALQTLGGTSSKQNGASASSSSF